MAVNTIYTNNSALAFRAVSDDLQKPFTDGAPIVTKPIDTVENIVSSTVDTFIPESADEETKKSHKTAIRVGSTVLVLSVLGALLNPRFLTKLSNKFQKWSTKAGNKAQVKDSKFYKSGQKILEKTGEVLNFSNNFNTIKDEGFKWLCEKVKFMKKPHELITKGFGAIAKNTVQSSYKSANKQVNKFNKILEKYAERLTPKERTLFNKKIDEIKKLQEHFSSSKVETRLKHQEDIMSDLEPKAIEKMKEYFRGYKNNSNVVQYAKNNLGYWAEDILAKDRARICKEGEDAISRFTGSNKDKKGIYDEIIDILSPHLKNEEKKVLEDYSNSTLKKINKANTNECAEYFDNKRDLVLGSAPTDVLTALFFLSLSGVAIGKADSKEQRISRALTGAFPIVAGLGASLVFTAKLYSGVKGKLYGIASSILLSLAGSSLNRVINPKKPEIQAKINA